MNATMELIPANSRLRLHFWCQAVRGGEFALTQLRKVLHASTDDSWILRSPSVDIRQSKLTIYGNYYILTNNCHIKYTIFENAWQSFADEGQCPGRI